MILCWLLGTSVRKTSRFLRTDMPRSQHRELFSQHSISMTQNDLLFPKIHPLLLRSLAEISLRIPWGFLQRSTLCVYPCAGYFVYPFQNEEINSHARNLKPSIWCVDWKEKEL